jgi:hypothetical protein
MKTISENQPKDWEGHQKDDFKWKFERLMKDIEWTQVEELQTPSDHKSETSIFGESPKTD